MAKSSPQTNYFDLASKLIKVLNTLIISITIFSIGFTLLDNGVVVNILSILAIFTLGILNLIISHYREKAETIRRRDFIDNSFGSNLHHESSKEYYDNEEVNQGLYKLAVNLFENTLFSSTITEKMKKKAMKKSIIPAVVIIGFSFYGFANSQMALPILQLFLSSLFLKEIYIIWVYNQRVEEVFDKMKRLFNKGKVTPKNIKKYEAEILSLWVENECNISDLKLLLDNKIYDEVNPSLTKEWEKIKEKYEIKGEK